MEFSQRLKSLMETNQVTAYRLAKSIQVHQTTIKNWLDGKNPKAEQVEKVSDYFNVSTDYLLGKEQKKAPAPMEGAEYKKLMEIFTTLSPENRQRIIDLADFEAQRQKKQEGK